MGVHGLWKFLEPVGKPIPLESLENKVLAVDISIWLYQLTKGKQSADGSILPNAHILGLFNRICKLLYYRIKPIFIFDGGVPILKKETIEYRRRQKLRARNSSEVLREKLLKNALKQEAVGQLLSRNEVASTSQQAAVDLFELPPLPENFENTIHSSEESTDEDLVTAKAESYCDYQYGTDVHSIDISSEQFKSLPPEIRHEILSELIETRKQASWRHIEEIPEETDDFSEYQMKRLLKRYNVQRSLDEATKEIGGRMMTLGELENVFREDGIVIDDLPGRRIAKDDDTRFIFVTNENKHEKNKLKEKSFGNSVANINETEIVTIPGTSQSKESVDCDHSKISCVITQRVFTQELSSDEESSFNISAECPIENTKLSQNDVLNVVKVQQSSTKSSFCLKNSEKLSEQISSSEKTEVSVTSNSTQSVEKANEETNNFISKRKSQEQYATTLERSEISKNSKESANKLQDLKVNINDFSRAISTEDPQHSESESDDDLIEVSDFPMNLSRQKNIEIILDSNRTEEFDIFSDIFVANENVKSSTTLEVFPGVSNESDEKQMKNDEPSANTQIKNLANIFEKMKEISNNHNFAIEVEKKETKSPKKCENDLELLAVQKGLLEEEMILQTEHNKQERLGSTITQQMISEAQELIRLFGLPYLIAPMEAEAQCAFLDKESLTEGTITDDSDIWLFGGRNVYKNFFDNRKYVLQFRNVDIEYFFKLSREQLIQMALLVGSDYTIGIDGIGPVTAIEILAYFSNKSNKIKTETDIADALKNFKCWLEENRNHSSIFSKKMMNISLAEGFPNRHVIEAYLYPTVDESKERFTWTTPDLDRIRQYMQLKFGWKASRIDSILLPIMKRLNIREKQTTLDSFFRANPFKSVDKGNVSERVIKAINIMKNKIEVDVSALPTSSSCKSEPTPTMKRRQRSANSKNALKARLLEKCSNNSAAPEMIPQREKSRIEAAKRKMEAVKILRANRKDNANKKKTLLPKADSSYLSESSSDED